MNVDLFFSLKNDFTDEGDTFGTGIGSVEIDGSRTLTITFVDLDDDRIRSIEGDTIYIGDPLSHYEYNSGVYGISPIRSYWGVALTGHLSELLPD
jgi:hypothetical protein